MHEKHERGGEQQRHLQLHDQESRVQDSGERLRKTQEMVCASHGFLQSEAVRAERLAQNTKAQQVMQAQVQRSKAKNTANNQRDKKKQQTADGALLVAKDLAAWVKSGKDMARHMGQAKTWTPTKTDSGLQRKLDKIQSAHLEAASLARQHQKHMSASAPMRRHATTLREFARSAAHVRQQAGLPPSQDISYIAESLPDVRVRRCAVEQLPPTRIPPEDHVRVRAPLCALGPLGPTHKSQYQRDTLQWETTVFPSLVPSGRQEVLMLSKWLDDALTSLFTDDSTISHSTAVAVDAPFLSNSMPAIDSKEHAEDSFKPLASSAPHIEALASQLQRKADLPFAVSPSSVATNGIQCTAPSVALVDGVAAALSILGVAVNELTRQLTVGCAERGELLSSIWDQINRLTGALIGSLKTVDEAIAGQVRVMHDELQAWAGSNEELHVALEAVSSERDELELKLGTYSTDHTSLELRALKAEKCVLQGESTKLELKKLEEAHASLLESYEERRILIEVERDAVSGLREELYQVREERKVALSRAEEAEARVRELSLHLSSIQASDARKSIANSRQVASRRNR